MPVVPKYERQVGTQALPNARVTTNAPEAAFGGGQAMANFSQATQGALGKIQQIQLEEQKGADDVATTKAWEDAVTAKNDFLYNEKSGAFLKKGKEAFGLQETYTPELNKTFDNIEKGLGNETQKGIFRQMRSKIGVEFQSELERHTFKEKVAFDQETTKSALSAAKEDAILNYHNPGKVKESLAIQQGLIIEHAKRNGMPKESLELMLREEASSTHSGVMGRMLANGQDREAKAYFDTVKGELSGTDVVNMEKALEEGSIRGESQRITDQLLNKHGSMSAALAAVRDIEDPKLRDEVNRRVRDEFGARDSARRFDNEKTFERFADILQKNGGNLDDIPPDQLTRLDQKDEKALKEIAASIKNGGPRVTDQATWYELQQMAQTPELRSKFMQMNLLTMLPKLSDGDFQELAKLQAGLRKGDSATEKLLDGYRSDSQIVTQTLKQIGINPSAKPGTDDAIKSAQFSRAVEEQILQLQQRTGKKATNAEVQNIVDTLAIEGITNKGFLGISFLESKKRLFEMEEGWQQFQLDVKDIPKDDREQIEAALRKNKVPITSKAILHYYQYKLKGFLPRGK